jgi:hypothetical protein
MPQRPCPAPATAFPGAFAPVVGALDVAPQGRPAHHPVLLRRARQIVSGAVLRGAGEPLLEEDQGQDGGSEANDEGPALRWWPRPRPPWAELPP